jgi:LmbE family N-acetylglucosaminyl deacetylase
VNRSIALRGFLVLAAACGGPPKAQLSHAPKDVYGKIVAAEAEQPCAPVPQAGPIPTAPGTRADTDFENDVVFYLAHPEDETLFTAGTMDMLVQAKRRVFEVVLSHGEGGRLIEKDATGRIAEKTGVPPAEVAQVRDRELARAMKALGIEYEHLYPPEASADFAAEDTSGRERAVHACAETLERWDVLLPDGLAGLLRKLVASIRTRKPRVIITHDYRDDEDWLDHGHHKALGAMVELAARAAADFKIPGGPPHVVEEFVTIAPKQAQADITLQTGTDMRKRLMAANKSQFELQKFTEIAQRATERYVVRWRAKGAPPGPTLMMLTKK